MVNSIRKYILQFQEIYIHLCGKNEKLFGHFLGSNVENTPDYAEISVINKINNKAFQINIPKKSEMKSTIAAAIELQKKKQKKTNEKPS